MEQEEWYQYYWHQEREEWKRKYEGDHRRNAIQSYVRCMSLSLRQALRNSSFPSMGELGEQIFIAHFESVALARASANNSISTLNSFTDLSSSSYSHWMTYNNRYLHKILLRDACPV
jgi:hypothetical protein